MIIDLHLHSYYSADGEYSIPELLNFYSHGDIVGITDHETIGGWEDFRIDALKRGIIPIFGVEWFTPECHILSYFVDHISQDFLNFMIDRRKTERDCMNMVYEKVREKYPCLPMYDEILKSRPHPEKILGLTAIAESLSKIADISFREAVIMVRDEKKKFPIGTRPVPFSPEQIIERISTWNAIPMLAHPYRDCHGEGGRQRREDVEKKIRELSQVGIKGIELFSYGSNEKELKHLLSLCNELGLSASIGSDYHNSNKGLNPVELKNLNSSIQEMVIRWLRMEKRERN